MRLVMSRRRPACSMWWARRSATLVARSAALEFARAAFFRSKAFARSTTRRRRGLPTRVAEVRARSRIFMPRSNCDSSGR
eukprot:2263808-Alexandrium_andersonii.AAC.1